MGYEELALESVKFRQPQNGTVPIIVSERRSANGREGAMTSIRVGGERSESGFTLIDMLFVISIIGLLSTIAIPGLMKARAAGQSASALGTIKVVNSAQLSFAITCGLGFYSPNFMTLGVPPPSSADGFLTPELSSGPTFIKGGYQFSMAGIPLPGAPASCNGLPAGASSTGYAIVGDPLDPTPPAPFFGSNADGVIYEDTASLGGTMPETGSPPSGSPIK
jgi:prepilin-type N-terminal cleavage/methylation domain-containing protein